MNRVGTFAVARAIWDDPDFPDEPFTEREAFLWLVGEAAWRPCRVRSGKTSIEVGRGQCVSSTRFMASKWKWPETTVRRFLAKLENRGMITRSKKSGAQTALITICNYERFQNSPTQSGAQTARDRRKNGANKNQGIRESSNYTLDFAGANASEPTETSHDQTDDPPDEPDIPPPPDEPIKPPERSTPPPPDRPTRSRAELDEIGAKCFEAAGAAAVDHHQGASYPGLLILAPILAWLDQGFDLEEDILPVIRSKRPKKLRSWSYFAEAFEEAAVARRRAIITAQAAASRREVARLPSAVAEDRPEERFGNKTVAAGVRFIRMLEEQEARDAEHRSG